MSGELAQKIEAFRDMRYVSLLIRELQASLFQEHLDCAANLMLQESLCGTRYDEIICISYDV